MQIFVLIKREYLIQNDVRTTIQLSPKLKDYLGSQLKDLTFDSFNLASKPSKLYVMF